LLALAAQRVELLEPPSLHVRACTHMHVWMSVGVWVWVCMR
jgi:hypothetical protein